MECKLGGRGAGGGQAPTLDWQFRVHTPLPWPLLVPLPEMRYLPSTITRTPMRPTKPSLNVAASGIPGGSHNTLIKFQHHLFCSRLSYLSTSAHAKSDRLLYEHRLGAGRGLALGGRRAGQVKNLPKMQETKNRPLGQARRLGGSNIWAWTWSSGHRALGQPRRRGGAWTSAPAS